MTPKMVDQDFFGGAAVADFCSAGSASIVLTGTFLRTLSTLQTKMNNAGAI